MLGRRYQVVQVGGILLVNEYDGCIGYQESQTNKRRDKSREWSEFDLFNFSLLFSDIRLLSHSKIRIRAEMEFGARLWKNFLLAFSFQPYENLSA